jgi:acyl-CoA reductase-like NAD-dependent aldehyde dehydrogenase
LAAERRTDLARLLALELGKPMKDGLGELDRVSDTFAICAAEARQIGGDVLPVAGWPRGVGNTALTFRAPAGIALAITPFNAPANLLAHKLGASFAAGNTTIVKSPPQAPAASTAVVALLLEAGAPAEAVQLLHGGGELGAQLCGAPEVSVISFTGSAATGAAVARAAGAKRLVLELGGNAATIICEDADVAAAARNCAQTGYSNSGQSCISVQRVYVHRSVFDEFVAEFTERVTALRVGDPLNAQTDVGSMVDDAAAERVVEWTADAAKAGATIAIGGDRDGAILMPTIVVDPPSDATVVQQEVFGALVAVMPYDDLNTVIEGCNASRFGLQAGLFTRDIGRIIHAWRELEVGGLVVNGSSNFRLDHVPFGGVKDSGFGRESPRCMIDDYTVIRTLLIRGESIWGNGK